jgi:hypothetical protein
MSASRAIASSFPAAVVGRRVFQASVCVLFPPEIDNRVRTCWGKVEAVDEIINGQPSLFPATAGPAADGRTNAERNFPNSAVYRRTPRL